MTLKPATKTIWLLILAAFLIGVGLAGLGAAFGAYFPNGINANGMNYWNWRTGNFYDARFNRIEHDTLSSNTFAGVEAFTSLKVITANVNIEIARSTDDSFAYEVRGPEKIIVDSYGDTLTIEQENLRGINLGGLLLPSVDGKVTVYVPEDWVFNEVELGSASGDIRIATGDTFMGKSLIMGTVSGNIESLDTLHCDDLRAESVSGNARFEQLYVTDEAELSSISGNLSATQLGGPEHIVQWVKLNTVSGDLKIETIFADEITAETISGNIKVGVAGLEKFSKQVGSISGDVSFDGMRMKSGSLDAGFGSREISVTTVSGDVKVVSSEKLPPKATPPEVPVVPEAPTP